jgi:hypothetical protein
MTIPGVGEMTALTWVLEIGDPQRVAEMKIFPPDLAV